MSMDANFPHVQTLIHGFIIHSTDKFTNNKQPTLSLKKDSIDIVTPSILLK